MKYFACCLLLGWGLLAEGQKYDNTWLWGFYPQDQNNSQFPYRGNAYGVFDSDTFISDSKYRGVAFSETNASISDPVTGQLLFYTNGLSIRDTSAQIIENGDSLGFGPAWHPENGPLGQRWLWSQIILPVPEHDSLFKLIYLRYDGPVGMNSMCFSDLKSTTDEMKLTSKDVKFTPLNPQYGGIAACRHGNGSAWWVIFIEANTNCYQKYLLTPNTFEFHSTQCYGRAVDINDVCKNVFSPDGSKLLRVAFYGASDVFDFDRCTGQLSNFIAIDTFHVIDTASGSLIDATSSGEISPNNRFVYLVTSNFILQYDLSFANVNSTRDTVGMTDYFIDTVAQNSGPYGFYLSQLSPDGRIFLSPGTGKRFFSTIESPNEKGDLCGFKIRSIQVPKWIYLTIPYFPNYRLGRLPGSACDTIYNDLHPIYTQAPWLKVYPNPATDMVRFDYNWIEWEGISDCRLLIYDLQGRVVMEHSIPKYSTRQDINVKALAEGLYTVALTATPKSPKGDLNSQIPNPVIAVCKLTKQ